MHGAAFNQIVNVFFKCSFGFISFSDFGFTWVKSSYGRSGKLLLRNGINSDRTIGNSREHRHGTIILFTTDLNLFEIKYELFSNIYRKIENILFLFSSMVCYARFELFDGPYISLISQQKE